ncbi:MAG: OpgC domain-containing protein [Chloroflexi bacterium]|nr:OpgC domain-containing protein [Chloroflexota bacterium]
MVQLHGLAFPLKMIRVLPRAIPHDWSYSIAGKRDLRIDLLRGLAVFMMVVNHFGGASWLFLVTGGDAFFVSAAEAFVFISGLTMGMVYSGIALEEGLRAAQGKAIRRAWTLYKLTVVLTLLLANVSFLFRLPWVNAAAMDNPFTFTLNVLLLRQTMYLSDVMLLYTFLMLATPLALWLLHQRHTLVLVSGSSVLWLTFQIGHAQIPWQIVDNPTFNFAAWQLVFFIAMTLGYHREKIKRMLIGLPRAPVLILLGTFALLLLGLHRELDADSAMSVLFVKSAVAPGRLGAGFILFSFAYLTATLGWKPIWSALGWLLMPLGQNALYAYTIHVGVIAMWYIARMVLPAGVSMNAEVNTSVQLTAVLLIWAMIQKRFLFKHIPR